MLKKRFIQYRKYAESTFDQVIDRDMQRGTTVQKIALLTSCWLENKGNRQWVVHQLPGAAQCAPVCAALVHDFNHDGHADLLLGGNIYQMQPAIGRLDASHGLVLLGNGKGQFEPAPGNLGFWVDGEIRTLEWDAAQGVVVTLADGGIYHFTIL